MTDCCDAVVEVGHLAAHLYQDHDHRAWPALVAARTHFGLSTEPPRLMSADALRGLVHVEPIPERPTIRRRTALTLVVAPVAAVEPVTVAPGRRRGGLKTAAKRIGVSVEEWQAKREQGLKWCHGCRAWQPLADFPRDSSRGDGHASACSTWRNRTSRAHYTPGRRQRATPHVPREQCRICADLGERAPCKRHGGAGYSTSAFARRARRLAPPADSRG